VQAATHKVTASGISNRFAAEQRLGIMAIPPASDNVGERAITRRSVGAGVCLAYRPCALTRRS
jgi:hypothetical protein